MIAQILVDIKAKEVDRTFDYKVPDSLTDVIEVGQRVQVPFGPRLIMGYVMGFSETSSFDALKSIKNIMDLIPSLTPELLDLGKQLAVKNTSSLVAIYQAMLPSALKSRYKKRLRVTDTSLLPLDLALRFNRFKEVDYDDSLKDHFKTIKDQIKTNNIEIVYRMKQHNKAQFTKYITLLQKDVEVRGIKQRAVIDYLLQNGTTKKQKIMKELALSNSTLKRLVDKNIIEESSQEFYREVQHLYPSNNKRVILHKEQQLAYDTITNKRQEHTVFLLHGITGSGKTEIYLNIIEDVIEAGKEAIMLVPEISLTPMMVSRFKGRFKDNVALLHSRLSVGEKYDEWRKIRRGEVQVVVGARSAIFAPFTNLGVIIIDEEHTDSYKQDTPPMYHAKDVAELRCITHGIPLILGSATPSVESYYRAKNGTYELLTLNERANQTTLPEVYIEDMRYEFQGGNRSIFSKRLNALIIDRLAKKEQIILLLNRRGHSTFVMCRNCGEVVMCPNCDISLTYHEHKNLLKCHYCGHEEDNPSICPYCESPHIRYMGIGTEKVEEYVTQTFPDARVIRMDSDTTTFKNAHEELLFEFEHEGDILIGTQMIAKGLDFPNVTLVGVLAADMSLNLPDYKAIEHTFQLLTQVSGRAGRHDKEGKVVIQTYNPDHYAIMHAKDHDYHSFYDTEMKIREVAGYTPFYQLVQIIVSDKDVKHVLKTGTKIVLSLRKQLEEDVMILGPVLPKIARINNVYRAQIIVKYKQSKRIHTILQELYRDMQEVIAIAIDTNPSLL